MFRIILAFILITSLPSLAYAGMPSPLPDEWLSVTRLTEVAKARLHSISFFAMGILVSTVAVRFFWNFIAADSSWLPRITLTKAFVLVMLWGALFVIVLTMISGARELLTPGAWKKNGITYTLEKADESSGKP